MKKHGSFLLSNNESLVDEKKLKSDDLVSLSTIELSVLNKSVQLPNFNIEDIRFFPEAIEFIDSIEVKQLTGKMTIQNVGRNPVYIKIGEPNSFIFQLKKPITRAKILGSGCSISRIVSCNYKSEDLVQSAQIPIQINGHLLYYPLHVKGSKSKIEIEPRRLDFGVINLGMMATTITLTIFNKGDKRTKYELDVKKNFLDLTARPMRGTVKPNVIVTVKVDLMGLKEGEFYQELWIKTADLPIRVPVLVKIIRPRIEFVHPIGAENLVLISFRPTFVNTQRIESIVIRNFSVEHTSYIMVAEVNGEIQLIKNARNSTPSFRMFNLSSEEGFLKPFEDRIVNIVFRPVVKIKKKGWQHKEYEEKKEAHSKLIVFFRIIKVHCLKQEELNKIEMIFDNYATQNKTPSQISNFRTDSLEDLESSIISSQSSDVLKFCLLGEVVEPDILFQPLDFDFGDLSLDQTENKVLRITNNTLISVKCRFRKVCNLKITPEEIWLKSGEAQEFLLSLTPKSAGKFKTKLKAQILAESDLESGKKTLETVLVSSMTLSYNAKDVPSIMCPKIGLGITPLITDEVGLQKELITYRNVSKLPYSAMLGLKQGFKPEWMRKEKDQLNKVDNAIIALPNDRPRLFYSWPKDKICRTIFKGLFRYSPPEDLTYTLSPEGKIERKERRAVWADYFSVLRESRLMKDSNLKEIEFNLIDSCFEKNCNTENRKLNLNFESESLASKKFKIYSEQHECFPLNTLVTLTPYFLYNIIVEPRLINFDTVTTDTVAQETVTVNNLNPFPIGIEFVAHKRDLFVKEKGKIIVQPSETKSVHVILQPNNISLHFGVLYYIINDCHKFQINTYATVNPKTLILVDRKKLSTDPCNITSDMSLNMISDSVSMFCSETRFEVYFINNHIDLGDIPLNLPVRATPIIRNAYFHDVCFNAICVMPGTTIEPREGVIKARSFLPLCVKLHFPVITKFDFEIMTFINAIERISVVITGNVVLPNLRMSPPEVIMRKICAYSLETFVICVENVGTTLAELAIDFKNWPEFSVANGQTKFLLPPKKSSNIVINFEPIGAARYVFYLPIIMNNILGPPMIQDQQTEFVGFYMSEIEDEFDSCGDVFRTKNSNLKIPFVLVNGTVTRSLLRLSEPNIQFRLYPSSQSEFQPENLEISNDFTEQVTFCIRNDDLGESNGSPFNLIPVPPDCVEYRTKSIKAELRRGEKLLLKATFNPKKLGFYCVEVPIFVKGYNKGLVYNFIYMSGELKTRLHCETSAIYFRSVPLDMECKTVLKINTKNYDAPDLINCLICDSEYGNNYCQHECLKTTWLNEPRITQSGTSYSFQLQVQFQSSIPIAIRKFILLYDSMGDYISILVTAVADNSSLTNHAFLAMKASKYRLVKDGTCQSKWKTNAVYLNYPINKNDLKFHNQLQKTAKKQGNKDADIISSKSNSSKNLEKVANDPYSLLIEEGPRLVLQSPRSPNRLTTPQNLKTDEKSIKFQKESFNSSKNESNTANTYHDSVIKGSDQLDNYSHLNILAQENSSKDYFKATLTCAERWIYELVMKGEQYLVIPRSFQRFRPRVPPKQSRHKTYVEVVTEKDFIDFLKKILGNSHKLPERPNLKKNDSPLKKAKILVSVYEEVLKLLEKEGCFIPHVRPEYLMDYNSYVTYIEKDQNVEYFSAVNTSKTCKKEPEASSPRKDEDQSNFANKSEKKFADNTSSEFSDGLWRKSLRDDFVCSSDDDIDKTEDDSLEKVESHKQQMSFLQTFMNRMKFKFKEDKLDEENFESTSAQAWLDIIIQIFRVFVLTKVVPKITIPKVSVVEKTDKIRTDIVNIDVEHKHGLNSDNISWADSYSSNIYSVQERTLLSWLNYHLQAQKKMLWELESETFLEEKVVNNFDWDLSDSIALIAVTATHCPYIVSDYFKNIFLKPDTQAQLQYNAQKLIEAWKTLSVGFTLKISDFVKPNRVFMVMLMTHLYEVLPALHPHSLICFSTPLNSVITRSLGLRNKSSEPVVYLAKFFGNNEELFQLKDEFPLELSPFKTTNVCIEFTARKIKKICATLILSPVGSAMAKHLTYYFEGDLSELAEFQKFSLNAPLYKVVCAEIPVNPPYPGHDIYEVWYTTKTPQYSSKGDIYNLFKPWSDIWKCKVSRRLFLNKSKIKITGNKTSDILDVTVACFTKKKRNFWLLFRSSSHDFIILIEINPKILDALTINHCVKAPPPSTECICRSKNKFPSDDCPFITNVMIPRRNDALKNALEKMFFKTLQPKEKAFWAEHFDYNSGICLILWLLSPDEEEEVVDEFVQVLSTKVTYLLSFESPSKSVAIPSKIEIPDVRERSDIALPIHVTPDVSLPINLKITMTSENDREIRMLNVYLESSTTDKCTAAIVAEKSKIIDSICQAACVEESLKPLKPQKENKNLKLKSLVSLKQKSL